MNEQVQPRRRLGVGGLLVLNGLLLVLLGVVTLSPRADAQVRVRGDYTMISGAAQGSVTPVVYVVDTVNQEMIVLNYEPSQKTVRGIGYRNLAADARVATTGGSNR